MGEFKDSRLHEQEITVLVYSLFKKRSYLICTNRS